MFELLSNNLDILEKNLHLEVLFQFWVIIQLLLSQKLRP